MSPVRTRVFHHEQKYFFKFHAPKLNALTRDEPRLRQYLLEIYDNCPDEFFSRSLRCSQMKLRGVGLEKRAKTDSAVALAKLALCSVKSNKMRHFAVQDFMLNNDAKTIACEVPVYLTPWEVPEAGRGLGLLGKMYGARPLSGHIDILQIRQGMVWILDYKPNAHYNVHMYLTQVFLYGICLSARTGIPMEQIRLAYFDDKNFFEVNALKQTALVM